MTKKAVTSQAAPQYLQIAGRAIDLSQAFVKGARTHTFDGLVLDLHAANKQRHEDQGPPKHGTFHWLATDYDSIYDDYTFCVPWNAKKKRAYLVKCLAWGDKPQHLWGRNSGTFAVGFCGMYGAEPHYLGNYPLQEEQLELGAQIMAESCAWKRIDPESKILVPEYKPTAGLTALVPTGGKVSMPTVTDHRAWARQDGYGAYRWDTFQYTPWLVERTIAIYRDLKNGRREFEFEAFLK